MRYTVVGAHRVAGVAPGGTVDLDPQQVDIRALVKGGHVQPAPEPAPDPAPTPTRRRTRGGAATAEGAAEGEEEG